MKVEDMNAQNLRAWILKLTKLLNDKDLTNKNRKLYLQWHKEAIAEQQARLERRTKFLEAKNARKN